MDKFFFEIFLAFLGIVVGIIVALVGERGKRWMLLIFGLLLALSAGLWLGATLENRVSPPTQPTLATSTGPISNPPISAEINCMGTSPGDKLKLLYVWTGTDEEKFNTILKPLVDKCGIKIITTKIALSNDPNQDSTELDKNVKSISPDILFWPWPDALKQYSSQLYDLNQLGANSSNYANSLRKFDTLE